MGRNRTHHTGAKKRGVRGSGNGIQATMMGLMGAAPMSAAHDVANAASAAVNASVVQATVDNAAQNITDNIGTVAGQAASSASNGIDNVANQPQSLGDHIDNAIDYVTHTTPGTMVDDLGNTITNGLADFTTDPVGSVWGALTGATGMAVGASTQASNALHEKIEEKREPNQNEAPSEANKEAKMESIKQALPTKEELADVLPTKDRFKETLKQAGPEERENFEELVNDTMEQILSDNSGRLPIAEGAELNDETVQTFFGEGACITSSQDIMFGGKITTIRVPRFEGDTEGNEIRIAKGTHLSDDGNRSTFVTFLNEKGAQCIPQISIDSNGSIHTYLKERQPESPFGTAHIPGSNGDIPDHISGSNGDTLPPLPIIGEEREVYL